MARILAALAALLLLVGAARAETVTITFDEFDDPDYEGFGYGEVGNVNYLDQNYYLYGHVSPDLYLGDDGFSNSTMLWSDEGTTFTPVSMEIAGSTALVFAACETADCSSPADQDCLYLGACDGYDFDPYGFDNLHITSYVDGELVAEDYVGGPDASYSGTYTFSSHFADVDAVTIEILRTPAEGLPVGFLFQCGVDFFQGCVSGVVDDFAVELGPAVVPLPAAFPALLLALGALGAVALRRRR